MRLPRKVLIIGGGFAGLSCAQKLAGNKQFEVTLIDRQNHHLFQPLLYQVATAALAAPDIARSITSSWPPECAPLFLETINGLNT